MCHRVTSGYIVSETLKPRDDKARVWLRSIRRKTGSSQRRSACAVTLATRSGPPSVASVATANCDRRPARAGAPDRSARCTVVNRRWFCSVSLRQRRREHAVKRRLDPPAHPSEHITRYLIPLNTNRYHSPPYLCGSVAYVHVQATRTRAPSSASTCGLPSTPAAPGRRGDGETGRRPDSRGRARTHRAPLQTTGGKTPSRRSDCRHPDGVAAQLRTSARRSFRPFHLSEPPPVDAGWRCSEHSQPFHSLLVQSET